MSTENSVDIENTNTFGNYLVHGIDEIILPEAVGWFPLAPGWKVLGLIVLLLMLFQAIRLVKIWWRNRYRREALRQLSDRGKGKKLQEVVALLPHFLKITALHAYPRREVASLSGEDWLRFLDSHYSGPSFLDGAGRNLLLVAYLPEEQWKLDKEQSETLLSMSRQWIATHKEVQNV